jgi:hypothetical protein
VKNGISDGHVNAVFRIDASAGKDDNCFSVILGNGAIVTFHYKIDESRGFRWGLLHKSNHVMLPNSSSCCGLDVVHIGEDAVSKGTMFVACSLRAGTTLFVPITGRAAKSSDTRSLTIHTSAFDATGVDDDSVRYVQGFVAGNIYIRQWGRTSLLGERIKVPMFFQAWASGYIDCFMCHAIDVQHPVLDTNDKRTRYLHQRLMSNGALGALSNILSLDNSLLLEDSLLKLASEEYKVLNCKEEELMSKIMEQKDDVQSIRLLLKYLISGCRVDDIYRVKKPL